MQKILTIWMMILGLMVVFGLHCGQATDVPEPDSGTDSDSDTDSDTDSDSDSDSDTDADSDSDSDRECVPAQCCHPTSCVAKSAEPDCDDVGCTASCEPDTLDCGQGFCDFVDGKCTAVFVAEMSCDERRNKASAEVRAVLLRNLDCEESDDCVTANGGTGCMGGCPIAVAKSGLQEYNETLTAVNHKYCSTFVEDGCPYASPGCLEAYPRCVDKKCEMVPVEY